MGMSLPTSSRTRRNNSPSPVSPTATLRRRPQGVSVMPVREAVNQLVAEQSLEVMPNRAVRVPVMTQEQFFEIRQIRIGIEGYAVA